MSNHTAIAAVTSTLKNLLEDFMRERDLPGFTVTAAAPDVDDAGDSNPRINLFLFRVTENAALQNQEIPGTGHPGTYGHPPLSLDLHYLVTAYGRSAIDDEEAHRLLGDAMLVFHDFPVITEELRRRAPLDALPVLDDALQGEFEHIKLTLEPTAVEDFTNLWSASTDPFRLSVAYKVTVVQIESERPQRVVQLVGEPPPAGPRVRTVPLDRPRIDALAVLRGPDEFPIAYAGIGETLVIHGTGFGSPTDPSSSVMLGEVAVVAPALGGTSTRLLVPIPDDPALQPGIETVQVIRSIDLGDPPVAHTALRSNVAAFVCVPTITAVAPASVGVGALPEEITITGTRLLAPDGDTVVLVHDQVITVPDPAVAVASTATDIRVVVDGLAARPGTPYRVLVRVDSAETVTPGLFEVTP